MKTWSCVMGLGLVVVLSGCGGSSGDDGAQSGAGAFSAGGGSSDSTGDAPTQDGIVKGDYVMDSSEVSGTLNVTSASASSVTYTLTVFQKGDSSAFASLHGRTAKMNAPSFVDAITVGCQVSFHPAGADDTIKLTVTGDCSQFGLGAFAHGSGNYTKGDTHGCAAGTTFDSSSARCAGSGGQNDPADNHDCSPGTTFDPGSTRCTGSGGQNDPLSSNGDCAPGTTFDPASARCAGAGGQNDPDNSGN